MFCMKSAFRNLFVLVCLIFLSSNFAFAQKFSDKTFVAGELLVKYKNGTASEAARSVNDQLRASVLEEFPDLGWQRVKLPENLSVDEAVNLYKNSSEIEWVQPNFYYHLLSTPNDPQYSNSGMYGLAKINAPSAWDLTTGSAQVVVADIDTGLRYTHEDLAANAWTNPGEIAGNGIDDDGDGFVDDVYGWDFFYNDSNPFDDAGGHGTHTAGTIGAIGNNGKGVTGVNWNVKIMAVKIYSPNGSDSTSAMLVNAYNYVRMMKNRGVNIRVTNNSYGDCGEACGYDQATKDALDAMGNAGILNVFAAGNDNQNVDSFPAGGNPSPGYPARYTSPSVMAVAASTSTDARASFSNYGATSIDVAAPGAGVLSTFGRSDTDYAILSGTSMATPHVAGAAALLSSYNPNLSPASLKATLMNTVDVLPAWSGLVKSGGRINVDRALRNQTVCAFNLSQSQTTVPTAGGTFSVGVTAPANCDFAAVSNSNWISVTSGNPGSGNTTVTFTVQSSSGAARSGTITVGETTFTVNQIGPTVAPTLGKLLDFDGDGKTDYSAIQNSGNSMIWHNYRTTNGYAPTNFGLFNDDVALPADFDGDGKADIAVWRNSNGTFYVLQSAINAFRGFQFGQSGDNPNISQDFDGDGKTDFAVTRVVNGSLFWYIYGSTKGFYAAQFGIATDKPLRGDFDGDGKADLAVYRTTGNAPANSFIVQNSSNNNLSVVQFGDSTIDKPVPADFDGDGRTDVAVFRSTNGVWYVSGTSAGFSAQQFGQATDLPAPGDYDGDGKTDIAVWRPGANQNESGVFYVQRSTAGFTAFGWGTSQMKIPANSILGQ